MRAVAIILILTAVFSCKKKDEILIDISDSAKLWVPVNKDSLVFKIDTAGVNFYGSNKNFHAQYAAGIPENYLYQQLTSDFKNYDNTFSLSFKMQTAKPEYNAAGRLEKPQQLTFKNNLDDTFYIRFLNDSITTDLNYMPEYLVLNTTYDNVFTDQKTFYYAPNHGVIKFFDGTQWYNLIKK